LLRFWIRVRGVERDLKYTWAAVFILFYGFGLYNACFYNYATDPAGHLHITPVQLGHVEAVRELPGFLCVLVAAITMSVAEPLLASMAFFLMAVGLAAYAGITNVSQLMVWSFVWSLGLHTWFPLQSSLSLHLSNPGHEGRRLGQTSSVVSLGALAGLATVMIVGRKLEFGTWFTIGAAFCAVGGVLLLFVRRNIGRADKPRLIWRNEYWLYYALTFLEGCRKQVFMTFAIYALTKEYGTPLRVVATLMVINGIVSAVGAPIVGKLIDRVGERKLLLTSYSSLILVFIGYATIRQVHVLYVLYCLDNLFYLSSPCLTTYIKKIARPEDLMPTLSMGVTVNHAAAVVVPLIGGTLWATMGYPVTFFGGAVVVAISVILASRVHPIAKRAI
jgi:predicted MFS family arabinose efflux permease